MEGSIYSGSVCYSLQTQRVIATTFAIYSVVSLLVTSLKCFISRTQLVPNLPEGGKKALWVANGGLWPIITVMPHEHGRKRRHLQASGVK